MEDPKSLGKKSASCVGLKSGDLQATTKLVPGLKPPITKFKSVEDISQEEGDAFIEMVRKWRHEGIEGESHK